MNLSVRLSRLGPELDRLLAGWQANLFAELRFAAKAALEALPVP